MALNNEIDRSVIAKWHLDSISFREFGQVIHVAPEEEKDGEKHNETVNVNQGSAAKHPWLAKLVNLRGDEAKADLSIFRCNPRNLDIDENGTEWFNLELLECHPHSSQIFIPMNFFEKTPGRVTLLYYDWRSMYITPIITFIVRTT